MRLGISAELHGHQQQEQQGGGVGREGG